MANHVQDFRLTEPIKVEGSLPVEGSVSLQRTAREPTPDIALWALIRQGVNAISFPRFEKFMDTLACVDAPDGSKRTILNTAMRRSLPFPDIDPYRVLKASAEVFLEMACCVASPDCTDGTTASAKTSTSADEAGHPCEFEHVDLSKLDDDQCSEELVEILRRLHLTRSQLNGLVLQDLLAQYLEDAAESGDPSTRTLPYLALVRKNLSGTQISAEQGLGMHPLALGAPARGKLAGPLMICEAIIREKLTRPCFLELIWSYWHEEGMLVQSLNAISQRFQNRRGRRQPDPLANLELDPLRPLNNLLWGYVQDEQHRLGIQRRVYEYEHHYGLQLQGQAVGTIRPADRRSKFIEAFHTLLHICTQFYKEEDDTTVVADAFPMLNALRETHLILSEGAHNQYGDLPWVARQEMLMQQWLLSRPEIREFLPTRRMVAYPESWMAPVDAMKKMQGWTDTSINHFRDLGVHGEGILLSIRFGSWNEEINPDTAANWANFWRPEIQRYIHAYRIVTGVDLTTDVVSDRQIQERYAMPSLLLKRRTVVQAVNMRRME